MRAPVVQLQYHHLHTATSSAGTSTSTTTRLQQENYSVAVSEGLHHLFHILLGVTSGQSGHTRSPVPIRRHCRGEATVAALGQLPATAALRAAEITL